MKELVFDEFLNVCKGRVRTMSQPQFDEFIYKITHCKENLTKHDSRTIQSALDYIHKYETTYPAVSGTKELIHFTEWLLKESKAD